MGSTIQKVYSLTGLQKGIFYSKLKEQDSHSYHLQTEIEIENCFTPEQIHTALELLSYQYEVLRSAIVLPESTGDPKQVIVAERRIPLDIVQFPGGSRDIVLEEYRKQDLLRSFDLQKDSLIRVAALLDDTSTFFVISAHHIILDGWSLNLLLQTFGKLLHQVRSGENPEQIKVEIDRKMQHIPQFDTYVRWNETRDKEKAYEFWSAYLEECNVNSEIFAQPRESKDDSGSVVISGGIEEKQTSKLMALAAKEGFTLNTIAEAAWGLTLHKYNCTSDAVFARILSGREASIKNADKILGMMIRSVPCRVCCEPEDTISKLCSTLYDWDLQAMEYGNVSLSEIQNHCGFSVNLIHTAVAFENYMAATGAKDADVRVRHVREQSEYPISVSFYLEAGCLCFNMIFDGKKYTLQEMVIIRDVLTNILRHSAEKPSCSVSEIVFQDDTSREIIRKTRVSINIDHKKTIVDYLRHWVETTPDKVAIDCYGRYVTYGELWNMASHISGALHSRGLQHNQCVVISSEKSVEVIASVYGVLLAGGVCVFVSDEYPQHRQEVILEETNARFVLFHHNKLHLKVPSISLDNVLREEMPALFQDKICTQDIAHIIFTSGSTGQAKGVCLSQGNIINTLMGNSRIDLHLDTDTVFMQVCAQTFDAFLLELHGCLMNGGRLVMVEHDDILDISKAKQLIKEHEINTVCFPTALFNQLADMDASVFGGVKYAVFGGEVCSTNCINRVLEHNPGITIFNLYGPTETTIYVTCSKVTTPQKKVNVGRPLRNTDIYILNGNQPCSVGMCGELCVGGPQVGAGYLNRPKEKDKGFVDSPFADGLMYRTGDFARWTLDGSIDFIGRKDNQIKLRGYRIELNEIETALQNIKGVMSAAVKLFRSGNNDGTICAYYMAQDGISEDYIRNSLEAVLPRYAVPSVFVKVPHFRLNKNGKIDRNKLLEPVREKCNASRRPVNSTQEDICTVVAEVLGLDEVGIDEDIFVLGCDSLKAMKLLASLKHRGHHLVISDFYRYRTVEKICEHLVVRQKIDAADARQRSPEFSTMDEVLKYLKKTVEAYQEELLCRRENGTMPLMANQQRVASQATIMSGVVIPFKEEFNIDVLTQSVLHLLNTQPVMRTTLRENLLVYKAKYKTITIPYLNLKNAPQSLKDQVYQYLTTDFYRNDDIDSRVERALHRVVAVKYSEDDCKLYIPIDHVIFDAVSGEIVTKEILRHYYNSDARDDDDMLTYRDYVDQLALGPVDVKKQDLLERLQLKALSTALPEYASLEIPDLKNYVIELQLGKSVEAFSKDELWSYAYRIFLKMVYFSAKTERIPAVVLCINREYRDKKFHDAVGLFVDSLPIVDTPDGIIDYEAIKERIKWLSEHNISAISMLSDKNFLKKFPTVATTMLNCVKYISKLPVFNYLGLYTEMTEPETGIQVEKMLKEETHVIRTVDVKLTADAFSFLVFCQEGRCEELRGYLQGCLDEMIGEQMEERREHE